MSLITIPIPAGATSITVDFTQAASPPPPPPVSPPPVAPPPPPVATAPAPIYVATSPVTVDAPKLTAGKHTIFIVGNLAPEPRYGWSNIVNAPGVFQLSANNATIIVNGKRSSETHPWGRVQLFAVEVDGINYSVRRDGQPFEGASVSADPGSHGDYALNFGEAVGAIAPFRGEWKECAIYKNLTAAQALDIEQALLKKYGIGGTVILDPVAPTPLPVGNQLDRAGLVQTFGEEFDDFDWIARRLHNAYTGANPNGWKPYYGEYDVHPDGWSNRGFNDEFQHYIDPYWSEKNHPDSAKYKTIEVSDGTLKLRCFKPDDATVAKLPSGRRYVSGCLSTFGVFSQIGGVWEARMKLPRGSGPWPAFWTVTRQQTPGGAFVEYDVVEAWRGANSNAVIQTNHNWFAPAAERSRAFTTDLPDQSDVFHDYAMDIRRDVTIFYIDGIEKGRCPTAPEALLYPSHMYLNQAVGSSWLPVNDAHLPATLEVAWVRVWKRT